MSGACGVGDGSTIRTHRLERRPPPARARVLRKRRRTLRNRYAREKRERLEAVEQLELRLGPSELDLLALVFD